MRIYRDPVLWEAARCRLLGQYSAKAVLTSVRRTSCLPAPRALPGKPRRHYPGRRHAPGIFHKTEDDASRRPKAAGPACPRHDSLAFRREDGGKQPSFLLLHCIPDLFIGEPRARFHCPDGSAEHPGDLVVGEPFDIRETDGLILLPPVMSVAPSRYVRALGPGSMPHRANRHCLQHQSSPRANSDRRLPSQPVDAQIVRPLPHHHGLDASGSRSGAIFWRRLSIKKLMAIPLGADK